MGPDEPRSAQRWSFRKFVIIISTQRCRVHERKQPALRFRAVFMRGLSGSGLLDSLHCSIL